MIAIIDYGSGNVGAIANIYKWLKVAHQVTGEFRELAAAERYILPGVGAFDATMSYLTRSGMVDLLSEQILVHKKKVLGICVGMQILADSSEEGILPGLGWIQGRVRKIDASALGAPPFLPHMGWNSVSPQPGAGLFEGVDLERGFYFLHSYFFAAAREQDVIATVTYGRELPCAVAHGNVFGVQFHPEKSHANGVAVFRNFAEL
ncbi:imidazole glycerol phosphate synthase subunit HisH [Accumulibacter sp.]|uniref:imidazole glycerol phosphate synthase subunit HisH n=1 Tax=Accumulibacter sp. TaxID=2053492 RepID=UPI0025F50B68|nr:imidazole glycerol phosphate synthase subunit HisH [Accumulibacter sp.]MCM8594240.1 imidazole glycerol phosphate synthase subunit HisH [Accumulibacter sp.]MCM8625806.1 imidazole glycerol phosphate synthase subunit HisH [Accumulibacter sp.]MDS4048384.1 imidazole glycerol phosphate synthase subunit HisH [Accumulibacter sp.]